MVRHIAESLMTSSRIGIDQITVIATSMVAQLFGMSAKHVPRIFPVTSVTSQKQGVVLRTLREYLEKNTKVPGGSASAKKPNHFGAANFPECQSDDNDAVKDEDRTDSCKQCAQLILNISPIDLEGFTVIPVEIVSRLIGLSKLTVKQTLPIFTGLHGEVGVQWRELNTFLQARTAPPTQKIGAFASLGGYGITKNSPREHTNSNNFEHPILSERTSAKLRSEIARLLVNRNPLDFDELIVIPTACAVQFLDMEPKTFQRKFPMTIISCKKQGVILKTLKNYKLKI